MALLQISEMDSFQRICADILTQNGIKINTDSEFQSPSTTLNDESAESDTSDIEDFDELFSDEI